MFSQTLSLSISHLFRMLIALGELSQGSQGVTFICRRKPDSSPNGSSGSLAISQVEQERRCLQEVLFVPGNQGKSTPKRIKSWLPARLLSSVSYKTSLFLGISRRKLVSRKTFPSLSAHQVLPTWLLNWLQPADGRMQTHPIFSHKPFL